MATNTVDKIDQRKMLEADLVAGVVLSGRYELLKPVARGGMGQVWVARAKGGRGFKRLLAVKTMLAADYEDARLEEMLFQEAKLASMIQHPNVIDVEDFGEHAGVCYIAMELVRGETLIGIIKAANSRGGIPVKIAVNLLGQVCRGLQAAHDLVGEDGQPLGLIHRDVTPGNVIVTYGGVAKLLDFGIAKATNSASLTQVGEIKGKMSYMAPEMLMQERIDRRVDVFAVGVMLYLATTGTHPFRGGEGGSNDVLARIVSDKPPIAPTDLTDYYPEALEKVVMKALAKNRDERYSAAEELLKALIEALPEAFDPSIDREIQEYLEELLSERMRESTAQIKEAEDMAEKSFPDVSKIRPISEAPEKIDPMREIARALFLVVGIIFLPVIILAAVGMKYFGKEVVTETVYLPSEVQAAQAAPPASAAAPTPPSAPAAPAPSASAPAPAPVVRKTARPDSDLWVTQTAPPAPRPPQADAGTNFRLPELVPWDAPRPQVRATRATKVPETGP